MYTIATLHDLRQHLNLADNDTASDEALINALQQASHVIESMTNRRYCPHIESRIAPIDVDHATELILPDDLLSLSQLTNGDGSIISLDDVQLVPQHPDLPASALILGNGAHFIYHDSAMHAISITGIWGWHDRWIQAWRDSDDAVADNPLSDTSTTLTVSDVTGANIDGLSPRFQVGHLLKIEDEYLRVVSINSTSNQLTVLRGVQGTNASSHAQSTIIYTYQPVPSIRDLCVRYAELMFKSVGIFEEQDDPILSHFRRIGA